MITYKRIPYQNGEVTGFRYLKDSRLTKERTIPHEVMDKFEWVNEVEYDEQPSKQRCKFCDAPATRQKFYWPRGEKQPMTIEMCDWHYHNLNLGKIAQLVRELAAEKAEQEAKEKAKKAAKKLSKKGKKKWQAKVQENHSVAETVTAPSQALKALEVSVQKDRSDIP